jgi:site-specific DNA-cytosine methylase
MAKRKASPSPAPSITYDSDEINVAQRRNIYKAQKTSHKSNSPLIRRTRWLECVLIPTLTQEESAALLGVITTTSTEPVAKWSELAVINPKKIELPAYERPLVLDGKRSRKSTYKGLTMSEFFPSAPRPDELQTQAVRETRPARKSTGQKEDGPLQPRTTGESRPARKSTGQHDHGPLHELLAASAAAQPTQKPPAKLPTNRPLTKSLPKQLPSPEASIPTEQCSENVSRSSSRRPRRSTARQSYVTDVLEDSDDELVTSAPAPRRRGRAAPVEVESDFEGEEAHGEGSQEEDFTEDDITQSEESAPELDPEGGYDSGLHEKKKSKPRNKASGKSTAAKSRPKPSQTSTLRGGTSRTGKQTGKSTTKDMLKLLQREAGEPKGLSTQLPPLSSIDEIFKDITAKALSLGLREALKTTPVPLRVATMCSGTESPLLALEMVQDALRSLGAPELSVKHLFSAEIVPYKQAYIERNFNPPIIFRDITEITSAVKMEIPAATTVYGSKVSIPGNVHILIAGTSCVDFSRLNKHRKDLDQEDGGESSKTWFAVLAYVKKFRPAIVILENVLHGPWDRMTECYREIDYEPSGTLIDTKNYYLPHTRQRGYLVCFDKTKAAGGNVDGIGKQWASLMADFRRHASSSVADFMLPDEVRTQQQSLDDNTKEYDWAACEIRHLQYRQEKRLGNARPFTFWSESGTMNVPETGSIPWYHKQPERVRDYMDIGMLRKAALFDVRHKMRIWDVSQNIDMFSDSTQFGITPCITPSGLFFVSDTGRALAPQELLSLQGLPLSKISFTTETMSEIQDLAGNAMSTTAVGPAILAALICGQAVLQSDTTTQTTDAGASKTASVQPTIVDTVTHAVTSATETHDIDMPDLLDRSFNSARRCYCEGSAAVAQQAIQQCVDCHHTTCKRCGGNPSHNYRLASSVNRKRSDPVEFERHLRSRLPQCLAFSLTVSDAMELDQDAGYTEASNAALNSTFTFSHVRRSHFWTAIYQASTARLELRLTDNGASWHLFGVADKVLPANSELRKLLEQPIAVAVCGNSLLRDVQWRQRAPADDNIGVQMKGSQPIASWLARLALPDYRYQQVWSRLHIQVPTTAIADVGVDLSGQYEALPLCGTAGDSLYKKLDTSVNKPIYLLHNPTRDGDPKLDRFVFTTEKERIDFGERPILASLDPKWSPCVDSKSFEKTSLQPTGKWQNLDLQLYEVDPQVVVHAPLSVEAAQLQLDCKEAELILKCDFTSSGRDEGVGAHTIDLKDRQFFAKYAYIFELMRRQLPATKWRPLPTTQACCNCSSCAPRKPNLRWMLTNAQAIKPYEDPATAAVYERAIKSRPLPILFQTMQESQGSAMQFGINLASLAHRAVARLPANYKSTCRLAWNLEQDMASSSNFTFKPFVLIPTEGPSSPNADLRMSCRLFPKQALVLHWMQQQELGCLFTIEEAEEEIVPALGWRVEVRAETDVKVRGGICADHPGFGKTITSLALIHSNLSDGTDIVADLRTRQTAEGGTSGLIATQATLIVAPNTLIRQWASEIRDKLGYTQGVLIVTSLKDLDKYNIKEFEKAKIVLVNRTVLGHPGYAERIANFVAMPGPATNSGRAFSQWLSHASKEIPAHLGILQDKGLKGLQNRVKSRYAELIESEDFKAVVPSRRLVGKDFIESKNKKAQSQVKGATKFVPVDSIGKPLFEQFFWNRIIVDEFHQYSPREYAALKALNADKRWGLSGTPAMTDFYDIAQIADLLNIPLRIGSDSAQVMAARNVRSLRKEMSDFERFDMMREVPSDCMHARIHEIAQSFLDSFVRQNVMDFDEMAYADKLVPVTLDIDHQAAYTELSQQLASQDMNIRKVKKSKTTTRDKRFMAAIEEVQTAEEALSKDAAFFERDGSLQTGMKLMVDTRRSEIDKTLEDLKAACFAAQHEVSDHNQALEQTARSLLEDRTLGDEEAISLVKDVIRSTARSHTGAMPQKGKASKKKSKAADDSDAEGDNAGPKESKDTAKGRELTAKVNALAKGLLTSVRSKRYIVNVECIRKPSTRPAKCDSPQCSGTGNSADAQVAVSGLCGHRVCKQCYLVSKQNHTTLCAATGCNALQHDYHLLWSHILDKTSKTSPYGAKLDAAIRLLGDIREKGEKATLFVQYSEQLEQAETALQHANIAATVVTSGTVAGEQIAGFCRNNNTDTVLVLNASDETAAGSNIQAANHVIFLSPLLRDNQYGYDSTMAQAIGRVRRHGQKRPIHVYRICALFTIDVDILEHREHRMDAMTELNASNVAPPLSTATDHLNGVHHLAKLQRVQLVREDGKFSLRPKSWLYEDDSDEQKMERMEGRDRAGWEDFSSQVKFSRAFAGDE